MEDTENVKNVSAIMDTMDIPPKHTLYINNLNDKIKLTPMKQALYNAFVRYGIIDDIVMRPSYRLRGQAFITYRDIESATKALRALQNFPFFDKPLVSKSQVIFTFLINFRVLNQSLFIIKIY